jgi:hypothetical protein
MYQRSSEPYSNIEMDAMQPPTSVSDTLMSTHNIVPVAEAAVAQQYTLRTKSPATPSHLHWFLCKLFWTQLGQMVTPADDTGTTT